MRIHSDVVSNAQVESTREPRRAGSAQSRSESLSVGSPDSAEFSDVAALATSLEAKLNDVADTRAERLSSLRAAVENGTYTVSPEETAAAMSRHFGKR